MLVCKVGRPPIQIVVPSTNLQLELMWWHAEVPQCCGVGGVDSVFKEEEEKRWWSNRGVLTLRLASAQSINPQQHAAVL